MVRLFVVFGLALLAGGAYAIFDGWPYRVLERGFTEVILGGLAAVAGLILLALAAVLAEIRRLRNLVSGAMAAVALSEAPAIEKPEPGGVAARPDPSSETGREAGHIGIATTLAAGAGAAAAAGALTSLAKAGEQDELPGKAAAVKEEGSETAHSGRDEMTAAEPSQPPSAVADEIDDWLRPIAPAALGAAPSDIKPDEPEESSEAEKAAAGEEEGTAEPAPADVGKPLHSDDEEEDQAGSAAPAAISAAEPQDADEAPKPEPAPASADRLWWPRVDRPVRDTPVSGSDEFNALREQLAGVVDAPPAPEVEPPRRDRGDLDVAVGWVTPRPWPPVTQPRDPGILGDIESGTSDEAKADDAKPDEPEPDEAEAEPAAEVAEAATVEPAPEEQDGSAPADAEAKAASDEKLETAVEAKPDETRAASEEGVIGAYQVGETQFTMYADGSIHARTPDGDYTFASMDELKAYLASEKDKLEPSSN